LQVIKIRHQVAVGGRVLDASQRPISGARVRLVAHGRPLAQETISASAGRFYFLDLPVGAYDLEASMPEPGKQRGSKAFPPRARWKRVQKRVHVTKDSDGNIQTAFIDLELTATTIRGTVSSSGGKERLTMAEVRIKGGIRRTFTDREGQFLLTEVEQGSHTVQVAAPGFKPMSKAVQVTQAGDEYVLDFPLSHASQKDKKQ
jgi:hypothetical protein